MDHGIVRHNCYQAQACCLPDLPHADLVVSGGVYLAAVTFLAYYVVLVYSERYQPGETGLHYEFAEGTMRIRSVSLNSPASRAGIESGDVLLAVDERRIQTWEDWRLYDHIYHPPLVQELPAWIRFVLGGGVIIYCGGGLTALLINYRRSVLQDRARFRMLVVGAFVGLAPLIPFLAAIFWGTLTESSFVWFFVSDPYRHVLGGLFIVFPICLAYVIVRHNVLRDSA